MAMPIVDAEYLKQIEKARRELRAFIANKNCAPIMLRLAWHDAGTYDVNTKTGGPNGSIRTEEEYSHGSNNGLKIAIDFCEEIKSKHPKITYADLYQLAGVVAVEVTGGPTVDFVPGRKDSKISPKEGRLPNATKEMANPPKEWDDTHNNCAYLNETHKLVKDVKEMLLFLKRSRIFYAISEDRTPYLSHQRSFWKNAQVFEDRDPSVIVSKVLDKDIIISEQTVRECLHFGDGAEDPTSLPDLLVRGCLLRIKYDDDVTMAVLNKSNLSHSYKYLAHVIIHCLGPRKGGYDELSKQQLSAMVALILNRPFNFSAMIFTHLKEMVKSERLFFLMYPRFLQIIFDCSLENLPKDPNDQMKLKHQNEKTVARGKGYRGRTKGKPPSKMMIGHIANVDYMPPANDRWRHDDSDSDIEYITMETPESQVQGEVDVSVTRAEGLTISAPETQPKTRIELPISESDHSNIRLFGELFSTDDVSFELNTTVQKSLASSSSVRDVGKGIVTEEPQHQQQEDESNTESEPDFHGDEMLRASYLNLKEKRKHDKEMAAKIERRRNGSGQTSGSVVNPDETDLDFDSMSEILPVAPIMRKRKKRPSVKEGKKMSKQLQKMTAKAKRQRLNIIVGSSSLQTTTTTRVSSTTTPVPSIMSMPTLHAPMPRVGVTAATSVTTTFCSATTSTFQPFQSSSSVDQIFQDLVARFSILQGQQTAGSSAGVSSSSYESQFAALQAQINNILAEHLVNRRMIEAMVEREKTYLLMLKSVKDETDSLKSGVNQLRIANTQLETRLTVCESENKKLREQVEKVMGDLPQKRGNVEGEESEEDNDEDEAENDDGDQGGDGGNQGGDVGGSSTGGASTAAPGHSTRHYELRCRRH